MKAIALAAIAAIIATGATAQSSQKLTASKANEYGLMYTLPVTGLDVVLEVEITEETPGEFYNYAKRSLGITDAITKSSRKAIVKSATITPRGIADPENRWLAQFKSGSQVSILLNGENIPLGINIEPSVQPDRQFADAAEATPMTPSTAAARQAVTPEMVKSTSEAKKAEAAAEQIFNLRETRQDILSGQSENMPADGRAMQLVLDNLQAQEAALTAMFAGTRVSRTVTSTVSNVPDPAQSGVEEVIARISPIDGIVGVNDLSGAPVTIKVEILEEGKLPVNERGEEKKFPKGGFAYNIPGRALVTIAYDGRTVATKEVNLAQAGVTFGLDPSLFSDKKEPNKLRLDPATGAVLELAPM